MPSAPALGRQQTTLGQLGEELFGGGRLLMAGTAPALTVATAVQASTAAFTTAAWAAEDLPPSSNPPSCESTGCRAHCGRT